MCKYLTSRNIQITLSLTWTLDDFKNVITNDIGSPPVSDVNLKVLCVKILDDSVENS